MPRGALAGAAFATGLAAAGQALAQATPPLPSREQLEQPSRQQARPDAAVRVSATAAPVEPCPFEQSSLQVRIERVEFTDAANAALPASVARILDAVRPSSGERPLSSLCRLRDQAVERLYEAGYLASVQIPPQEIDDARLRLQVTLARLVDVELRGNPGPLRGALAGRIARLKALTPFNRFAAERILLLASDVPGLDVALSLRSAGRGPGEVSGVLAVNFVPWAILTSANNHGSRAIGRESATTFAEYRGITGLSDRTFVGVTATPDFKEQLVVQAGHYAADANGNRIGIRASHGWSRPDVGPLDLRARSIIVGLEFGSPLVRTVNREVSLGGGVELIEQRVRLHGDGDSFALTRDKTRVAFLRLSGATRGPLGSGQDGYGVGGTLELRQGLDLLGATRTGSLSPAGYTPSRPEGEATATIARAAVDGSAGVGALSLGASLRGQWASDPLLAIEEYSVGNLTIGRGYDPGVTSGDRAVALRLEPAIRVVPGKLGAGQLFAFYDSVRIWNLDSLATENGRTLRSWGAGVRLAAPGRFVVEAAYARPQDRGLASDAKRAPERLLLSLTSQFSPGLSSRSE